MPLWLVPILFPATVLAPAPLMKIPSPALAVISLPLITTPAFWLAAETASTVIPRPVLAVITLSTIRWIPPEAMTTPPWLFCAMLLPETTLAFATVTA